MTIKNDVSFRFCSSLKNLMPLNCYFSGCHGCSPFGTTLSDGCRGRIALSLSPALRRFNEEKDHQAHQTKSRGRELIHFLIHLEIRRKNKHIFMYSLTFSCNSTLIHHDFKNYMNIWPSS